MGYPAKMQAIKRGEKLQWVINLPAAIAAAMDFKKSEVVEWEIEDRETLKIKRHGKKKRSNPKSSL